MMLINAKCFLDKWLNGKIFIFNILSQYLTYFWYLNNRKIANDEKYDL